MLVQYRCGQVRLSSGLKWSRCAVKNCSGKAAPRGAGGSSTARCFITPLHIRSDQSGVVSRACLIAREKARRLEKTCRRSILNTAATGDGTVSLIWPGLLSPRGEMTCADKNK